MEDRSKLDPVEWAQLDEPPDELPGLREGMRRARELAIRQGAPMPAAGVWWALDPQPDDVSVYGSVQGDGGKKGPFVVQLFVYAGEDGTPRWPTFPEWASLVDLTCLRGARMVCMYDAGVGYPHVEGDFVPFIVAQIGTVPGSEADTRANFARIRQGAS